MNFTTAQRQINNMELFGGGTISNVCGYLLVDGQKNIDWLKEQVNKLFELNDALRIRLNKNDENTHQYVEPYQKQEIKVLHFSDTEEFYNYALEYAKEPLPSNNVLCEILLVVMPDKFGIMPKIHHIIGDAWAIALIGNQFNALLHGETPPAYSFTEYIEQEKDYISSKRYKKDEEFFINQMTNFEEPVYISNVQTNKYYAKRKTFVLTEKQAIAIKEYAQKNNTSVFTFFFSIWSAYLSKINNNCKQLCIGTTVLNRNNFQEKNTVGLFVNTVPVFIELDWKDSFLNHLENVETATFSALRHQRYNYQNVLQKIKQDYQKPYDIILSYQNTRITGPFCESIWLHNGMQLESLQVHIEDRDNAGILNIHYDYQTEKFTDSAIDVLHNHICKLIYDTIERENEPLYKINYFTEDEKNTILNTFNNTEHTYNIPDNSTLYSLFEVQAEKNKEKVCLKADNKEITFGDFKAYSERIDSKIRNITNSEKSIIAVICERSFEMYGAVYGIIRGGNAYLPIDPNYPQERIDYILSNSNAKAVVTQDKFCHLAGKTECINATEVLKEKETINSTPILATPEDTAYVIYTSGSTGNPKGAKISHKSAVNRILWMDEFYPLEENDVILQKTPYTFDVSVWELFWWGMKGRTLCASKPDEHFLPAKILEETNNHKVTHLHFVPSVFDIFLTYLENNPEEQKKFESVKYVFLSGEALTANSIKRFYDIYDYNKVSLHNLYGPTECAVDVSYYDCKPEDIDPVPIGKPIYNTQLYVVDKYMNPTPIGVVGELCIGGVNVGQGYLNNEELTKEKFIENPFHEGKMYRTGDLAYFRKDGQIIFCGRIDHQIKLNGQRIELGEIENAIGEIDGVVQCAVIVRKDNENRQYICAFYTGKEIEVKELRSILSTTLPRYMVPHVFTYMEEMPMTVSGKLDRKALPEIEFNNINTDTEYVAPETKEEKALAAAIEEVLNTEKLSMEDNFFNVGGDSISAIYIVSVLEEMGYELHVADIMQSERLSDVAKTMESTDVRELYDQYEVNGVIPFAPIMKAFLHEEKEIPKDFVHICTIAIDCDEVTAKKAINILVSHHDMLRGRFIENGIEILPSEERKAYSFQSVSINDTEKAKEYLSNTSVGDDRLVNITFCKTEKETFVRICVHHFLIDLISWEVLMKDFVTVVNQLKNGEKITLPAKTASFKLWNEKLRAYGETMPEENRVYWDETNEKLNNTKSIYKEKEDANEAEKYSFTFNKEMSDKLINEVNAKYGTRTNEVLLTALGLAAGRLVNGTVGIMVESHGRTDLHKPIATERTIGWFTACYPVVVNNNENVAEELINTKETMRRIPKNGIEYLLMTGKFHENTDILFNFYKTSMAENNITFEGTSVFPRKINVNCFAIDGIITVNIDVPKGIYKANIGEELGKAYVMEIENIIDVCTATEEVIKTRSDFSDDTLTENELDEIMDLFN